MQNVSYLGDTDKHADRMRDKKEDNAISMTFLLRKNSIAFGLIRE